MMKKLFILINVLLIALFVNAQYPTGRLYPVNQSIGSDSTLVTSKGGLKGRIIVWNFLDTTAANLQPIKNYAGAFIFTTSDNANWARNSTATKWISLGSNNSVTVNNFNDSLIIICFGNGVCDTVYNDFFFQNDSTIISCSPQRITCIGDSCFSERICDTINIPKIIETVYQNGLRKSGSIVEYGNVGTGEGQGNLIHDTWLFTNPYNLTLQGRPTNRPPISIQQLQWVQLSSSIISFNHYGTYPPTGLIDSANGVNLYINYTNNFRADTTGFMGNRIGYLIMGNSKGSQAHYILDNNVSKQAGIMIHTLDTAYTDAVTIFGNQIPSAYNFSNNPPVDSTLLDARIAVFHTTGQVQFPQYTTGAFPITSPTYIIAQDASGNLFQYPPGGITSRAGNWIIIRKR